MKGKLDSTGRAPQGGFAHGRRFDFGSFRDPSFGSSEHRSLGDLVELRLPEPYEPFVSEAWTNDRKIRVGNSELTYGQIVALAGDLYGVPDRPISDGTTDEDRGRRFLEAFATLQKAPAEEVQALVALIEEEAEAIARDVITKGVPANVAAKANNFDDRYTVATGSVTVHGLQSRYVDLAATNFDHFGFDAVIAYATGHREALNVAQFAYRIGEVPADRAEALFKYEQALGMNAFADHFLTDLFAAGHLRVPRRAAVRQHGEYWGGMASKAQHDEDNHWGLFVKNANRECWKCYGDEHLNTQQGAENRERARAAVKASALEIYNTFLTGALPGDGSPDFYSALSQVPDLDEAMRRAVKSQDTGQFLNFAPLFIPAKNKEGEAVIAVRDPWQKLDKHKWHATHYKGLPWYVYKIDHIVEKHNLAVEHPPADYLPAPKDAPTLQEWKTPTPARTDSPVKGKRVRYAFANIGRKQYPDAKDYASYSSEQGPWSDWIETRVAAYPVLGIPKDPDSRTVSRMLIRQVEGDLPELNYMAFRTDEERISDVRA